MQVPDSDPDGGTLVHYRGHQSRAVPAVTITINGEQPLLYARQADFNGQETFSYTLSDGQGGSDTGQVTVTVTPSGQNDPPGTLARHRG